MSEQPDPGQTEGQPVPGLPGPGPGLPGPGPGLPGPGPGQLEAGPGRSPPPPRLPRRRDRSERSRELHTIGDVMEDLLARRELARGRPLGVLAASWETVVGPQLAAVTTPTDLVRGVLVVRATTAPWAAQVRFLARDIAAAANRVLDARVVANVQVTVGKKPPRAAR